MKNNCFRCFLLLAVGMPLWVKPSVNTDWKAVDAAPAI
jgi:hypothetical protein